MAWPKVAMQKSTSTSGSIQSQIVVARHVEAALHPGTTAEEIRVDPAVGLDEFLHVIVMPELFGAFRKPLAQFRIEHLLHRIRELVDEHLRVTASLDH